MTNRHQGDLLLCFALVVALGGALVWTSYREGQGVSDMAGLWAEPVDATGVDAHAVIIAQPSDCSQSASMLDQVVPLLRVAGLKVRGLLVVPQGADALADSVLANNLFPVAADRVDWETAAKSLRSFGYRSTPLLALVDVQGRVRYLAPLTPDSVNREVETVVQVFRSVRMREMSS